MCCSHSQIHSSEDERDEMYRSRHCFPIRGWPRLAIAAAIFDQSFAPYSSTSLMRSSSSYKYENRIREIREERNKKKISC